MDLSVLFILLANVYTHMFHVKMEISVFTKKIVSFFMKKKQSQKLSLSSCVSTNKKTTTTSIQQKESESVKKENLTKRERCPSCKLIFNVTSLCWGENKKCYDCYDYEPRCD